MTTTNTAAHTTIGVYSFANLVTNLSDCVFETVADSIHSNILLTVELSYVLFTLILINPFILMLPLNTLSFFCLETGIDSPVKGERSKVDSPSTITPSNGILSPGLTKIISFTLFVAILLK